MLYSQYLLSVQSVHDVELLAKYLDISDASFTASSESDVHHTAKTVSFARYHDHVWTAASGDHTPWVQFDMEQEVTAWGVLVECRSHEPHTNQSVTSLKVAASVDRVKWEDVSKSLRTNRTDHQPSYISWFDEAATAQYWKIHVLEWYIQPSMKADLLGHPKGKR